MTNRSPRQAKKAKYAIPSRTNVSSGVTSACQTKLQSCATSGNLNSPRCLQFRLGCCKP